MIPTTKRLPWHGKGTLWQYSSSHCLWCCFVRPTWNGERWEQTGERRGPLVLLEVAAPERRKSLRRILP